MYSILTLFRICLIFTTKMRLDMLISVILIKKHVCYQNICLKLKIGILI